MSGLLKYGKLMLSKYKQNEKVQHRTRVSTADAQHVVKLVNKIDRLLSFITEKVCQRGTVLII